MVDAVVDSFRATGGDLDVGNHLPALLRPLGFEIRELRPVCRIARPNEPLWAWLTDFFAGYLPRLVETGQLSAEALVAFQAEWATRSEDADAFCFPPPMLELIATKTRDR
jgi:hypothetical protein